MKKGALAVLFLIIFSTLSYAVLDDDQDGAANCGEDNVCGNADDDQCPNSDTTLVDQFGCTCAQKTASNCPSGAQCCVSDNNPCTDDCGLDNIGRAVCNYVDNNNACPNGVCSNGQCRTNIARERVTCVFRRTSTTGGPSAVGPRAATLPPNANLGMASLTSGIATPNRYARFSDLPNNFGSVSNIQATPQTCAAQNGNICPVGNLCSGLNVLASDSKRCCQGNCIAIGDDSAIRAKAEEIGSMYNCPAEKPNVYFIAGNVGYSFTDDEAVYAYAKLLNEKGCHKGNEKYVIFYVSTVNFPVNGKAEVQGSDAEQKWLEYWNMQAQRFSDLGYKIIIHPLPYIINDNSDTLDYAPSLRPLVKADLNLAPHQIPAVYRCRAGDTCKRNGALTTSNCYTTLASVFDARTMNLAETFYTGVQDFFSKYPAFTKITISAPSDFGEYGFPFGIEGRWWMGSSIVGQNTNSNGCFLIGDNSVPPGTTTNNFNLKLNEYFMPTLAGKVKNIFPSSRYEYMVFMGYGNDINPRDGFTYANIVNWAQSNGVKLHSAHAFGHDSAEVPLGKIASAKVPDYELTFENAGMLNEHSLIKVLYHAAKYGITGLENYPHYIFDNFYLNHLAYSMGPSANRNAYADKGMIFSQSRGLASLKSLHLTNGEMSSPLNDATINGDNFNEINGWAFFEAPYTDQESYTVRIYAGHLMENSPYSIDSQNQGNLHPEYMRLVGSTITQYERQTGLGDKSGFKFNWKPNLATGKAVIRVYLVNSDSKIIAEHTRSPITLTINSRITGRSTLTRNDYDYGANNVCSRYYTISGTATDSQRPQMPGQTLDIVIIDEYRGRLLALGKTSGNEFRINFEVPNTPGEETQVITPRAYVNTGTDLVALPTQLQSIDFPLISKLESTVVKC